MAIPDIPPATATNSLCRPALRPEAFNLRLAAPARLAPGVLGLAILLLHDARRFRFSVNAGASRRASGDDVEIALMNAVERTLGHGSDVAIVEEVVVLLRSGSLSISCEGITSRNLRQFLRRIVSNIIGADNESALG